MNINTQPLIQEELLDTRLEDLRADAHDLIDSISDIHGSFTALNLTCS